MTRLLARRKYWPRHFDPIFIPAISGFEPGFNQLVSGNQTANMEKISKCPCASCGAHVEFDASELAPNEVRKGPCPSCGAEMWFFDNSTNDPLQAESKSGGGWKSSSQNLLGKPVGIRAIIISGLAVLAVVLVVIFKPHGELQPVTHPSIATPESVLSKNDPSDMVADASTGGEELQEFERVKAELKKNPNYHLSKDSHGNLPLNKAAFYGYRDVVRLLLAKGADVNPKGSYETTPLNEAAHSGSVPVVELLLANGAIVDAKDSSGETPIVVAARNNKYNVALLLLAKGKDEKNKSDGAAILLNKAISRVDVDLAKTVLTNKFDINAKDNEGITPLISAVSQPQTVISRNIVLLMIEAGANIEAKDSTGKTPLSVAAWLDDPISASSMVELLLSKGANPNTKDNGGNTPLISALTKGSSDAARLLIAKGADVNAKNNDGRTPLFYTKDEEIADLMLSSGAKINAKDNSGWTPLRFSMVEQKVDQQYVGVLNGYDVKFQQDRDWQIYLRRHGGRE